MRPTAFNLTLLCLTLAITGWIAAICYVNAVHTFRQIDGAFDCRGAQIVTDFDAAKCLREHGIDPTAEFGPGAGQVIAK